jgi:NAD(P)-dependent dehydrogenase (short-subunit alcohol dehydrogenase family)
MLMKIDLSDNIAIVSGSGAGIGFAIAKGLAEAGAHIIVCDLRQDIVDAAVEKLTGHFGGVEGFAADLSTAEGCDALVTAHPHCDILINSVGVYGQQDFFEAKDSDWQRFFDVNVMSGVRLSRAYAPSMLERNWGRIVFISSESALAVPVDMMPYGFSKTAQLSVARGLAKRLAGTNVTVNAVLPGATLSDGLRALFKDEQEQTGRSIESITTDFIIAHRPGSIIRRAASVEEVANMVVYVASPQASATTGAALRVDGGIVDTIA